MPTSPRVAVLVTNMGTDDSGVLLDVDVTILDPVLRATAAEHSFETTVAIQGFDNPELWGLKIRQALLAEMPAWVGDLAGLTSGSDQWAILGWSELDTGNVIVDPGTGPIVEMLPAGSSFAVKRPKKLKLGVSVPVPGSPVVGKNLKGFPFGNCQFSITHDGKGENGIKYVPLLFYDRTMTKQVPWGAAVTPGNYVSTAGAFNGSVLIPCAELKWPGYGPTNLRLTDIEHEFVFTIGMYRSGSYDPDRKSGYGKITSCSFKFVT